MVVVCGGLLQPRHLPILSAPGWDTRQPGPRHSDNDCMRYCRLWISSGRRNRIFTCNFVRFCSCLYVPKMLTLLYCIMIYYSQYRAFTKLMFRCSDAVLHPGSWQPTPIITTSSPPSWPPASSLTWTRTGN